MMTTPRYTTTPTSTWTSTATHPSTPTSGSEYLFITYKNSEMIELDLSAGDTLTVSYSALGSTTGKTSPPMLVELVILDPLKERLLEVEAMQKNSVELQVETTGPHQMVFTNPARINGLMVPVEYTINP